MATTTNTTVLKTPTPFLTHAGGSSSNHLHYRRITSTRFSPIRCRLLHSTCISITTTTVKFPKKFLAFASDVDNIEAPAETQETDTQLEKEENTDSTTIVDSLNESDDAVVAESTSGVLDSLNESDDAVVAESTYGVLDSLRLYKEALSSNDEAKIAEVESFLRTIENEKIDLENKLATILEELSKEKVRLLRTSVEFDLFRKRTESERLSLVTNAKEAVLEVLLPVMDDFERAKEQIKVENKGEEKVNNSYQSIYKQFAEILQSLQVVPVEETASESSDPAVTSQPGSGFGRVIGELRQKINTAYSGFTKNWIRQ